jgi:hypothetical protein
MVVVLCLGITVDCEQCSGLAHGCASRWRTAAKLQKRKIEAEPEHAIVRGPTQRADTIRLRAHRMIPDELIAVLKAHDWPRNWHAARSVPRGSWRLTNLRRRISPDVDLRALISKRGRVPKHRHLPAEAPSDALGKRSLAY